ncbi:unnamed protein product [Darwinula stevensoni]|uniref:Methyltransferase type 11 domain-containing protein n=1 Tax=Darwinula stevensoni TaxID=69355 RepID=A0A7R9A6S8_9CRUS|nr:unnamed protein product [Darwinula stevensoni]CAG0890213.1 unnamed protein product [Darwinula stevensoni]
MWFILYTVGFVASVLYVYSFFRRRLFASFMEHITSKPSPKITAMKKSLFESMKEIVSSDPESKRSGRFRLLEIGPGTGTNFEFYPSNAKLSVLEPDHSFKDYFARNKQKFPHLELENFYEGWAQDMKQVRSGSIDAVVCTRVLCSVPVRKTGPFLAEVKRVLAPKGRFYFVEHVGDRPGTILRWIQNALRATFLYGFLTCGCIPNKSTDEDVKRAGFSSTDATRFHVETDAPVWTLKGFFLRLIASHVAGVAGK